MATPATLNVWLDQLSTSILEKNGHKKPNAKKLQDTFRKRVKKHVYGRTNQFEVENRLDGLEEKFQILSLDNLSDALRQRRIELRPFENHWLPDVLDLFLHLSGNPAANQTLLELYRIPPRIGTPPPLKWKDLIADSPIDRNDTLWKVPDFRDADDSGYDDDFSSSIGTATSSPRRNRQRPSRQAEIQLSTILYSLNPDQNQSRQLTRYQDLLPNEISEVQFIRESLFLLRGHRTICFVYSPGKNNFDLRVHVRGLSNLALDHVASELSTVRQNLDRVTSWTSIRTDETHVAAMKEAAETVVYRYYKSLDEIQQNLIDNKSATVVTLSSTMRQIELIAADLDIVARFLDDVSNGDSILLLEVLYSSVQMSQLCIDTSQFSCLVSLLIPALNLYIKPVLQWMRTGSSNSEDLPSFITVAGSKLDLRRLWSDQFRIDKSARGRPPNFLLETVEQVLACGKTAALLTHLGAKLPIADLDYAFMTQFEIPTTGAILLPFAQTLEHTWQQFVDDCLHRQTMRLKVVLSTQCDFKQALDSIEQLYFPRSGLFMHDIELRIFDRIDRCIDTWNDRFQLRDMLEDAFTASECHGMVDSINIHSAYTSARTMQSQRTSVKILSSLSFEYVLSWPLANIISDNAMTSYRRLALILLQIRRAKYSLERTGYVSAVGLPLSDDASHADQRFAQVLAFTLLTFINTLLDSIMLSSIWPTTDAMQAGLQEASTVDEMIRIHHDYITRLECSCLAAPRLKLLRQSLQTILDLCIRFSDLVSNPGKVDQDGSDHEAGSFISAKSRNRSFRMGQYGSDDDDEDDDYPRGMGDGYSSFIILDETTSIVKELRKVKVQYEQQIRFLITGLRGVSKGGHSMADLDALADRLSWLDTR